MIHLTARCRINARGGRERGALGAQAHAELRAVIDGLAPPDLEAAGLAESLRRYAGLAGPAHGIRVTFTAAELPAADWLVPSLEQVTATLNSQGTLQIHLAPPLLPIIPIHVGENVVARLDFDQPFFVHARGGQLVVQRDEAEQMVFHAAARVIGTRASA